MTYLSRQGGKGFMLYFCGQFIAVIYSEVFPWWPIFTDARCEIITSSPFQRDKQFDNFFCWPLSDFGLSPQHLLHRSHDLIISNSVWRDSDTFWHRSMCLGTGGEIGEPLAQPITITITIHNSTTLITLWKTPNGTFWHRWMHFGRGEILSHLISHQLDFPKHSFL